MAKAQLGGKDLVDLVDTWAPQIEKTTSQVATKGPKMLDKGRKIAKSKGVKVPKKHHGHKPLGGNVKKLIAVGGLAALAYMAVRRLLGGGAEWQTPDPVSDPVTESETLDVTDA